MKVTFIDSGREPKCPPDPAFPKGMDVDLSLGAVNTCAVELLYPSPRCGQWLIKCERCQQEIMITTAGRPDDPRSVKLACKEEKYPRGKLNDDDEGSLEIYITVRDKTLIIEFGKELSWIGMSRNEAIVFAQTIIKRAEEICVQQPDGGERAKSRHGKPNRSEPRPSSTPISTSVSRKEPT
jgi:hypothetical protein